jgi:nitronate monooxygenase
MALLAARETDTMPVLGTLHNTLRAWRNPAAERVLELEQEGGDLSEILSAAAGEKLKTMIRGGEIDAGVIACSQGIGLVEEVRSVSEVIDEMMEVAEGIRDQMHTKQAGI